MKIEPIARAMLSDGKPFSEPQRHIVPAEEDVSRFNQHYKGDDQSSPSAIPTVSTASGDLSAIKAASLAPLGDKSDPWALRILQNLEALEAKHDKSLDRIKEYLDAPELDAQELFKLQFDLHRLTAEQLLVAKTAGKSVQNFDTLLKAQ